MKNVVKISGQPDLLAHLDVNLRQEFLAAFISYPKGMETEYLGGRLREDPKIRITRGGQLRLDFLTDFVMMEGFLGLSRQYSELHFEYEWHNGYCGQSTFMRGRYLTRQVFHECCQGDPRSQ